MYCRRCGHKISSDSKFCPKCGEKVIAINDKRAIKDPADDSFDEERRNESGIKPLVLFILTCCAITLVVFFIVTKAVMPREGALNKTFQLSDIEISSQAHDDDFIVAPIMPNYGINASKFEEYGFGMQTFSLSSYKDKR